LSFKNPPPVSFEVFTPAAADFNIREFLFCLSKFRKKPELNLLNIDISEFVVYLRRRGPLDDLFRFSGAPLPKIRILFNLK